MYIILFLVIICAGIWYFTSSKLNPVGYYPTNSDDIEKIIHKFDLKDDQVVVDLGAGTGRVIFEAALIAHNKGLQTQFIAIDINFILILIMWVRRLFHPNKENIKLVLGDIFKYHFASKLKNHKHITFYAYLSPWLTKAISEKLESLDRPLRVVSYYYPLELKNERETKGVNTIYTYDLK